MSVPTDLRAAVGSIMAAHWRPEGFTVPNRDRYPWQWLWDSCFHALIWLELGDADRAVTELTSALADQDEAGFVPHVRYAGGPSPHAGFWGRPSTSSITQPPMYGHAVAALLEAGVALPEALVAQAVAGLEFLLRTRRRHPSGLVTVVHPWETGCDDSPRFDHWGAADPARWYETKGSLLTTVERATGGAPLANPAFDCAPAGFNALVAWNAVRLGRVAGDERLGAEARALADALEACWDADLGVWVDAGAATSTSGRCRTLDGLLPLLVASDQRAGDLLEAPGWRGAFGPPGVHRDEPVYEPRRYWRGGVWAPLGYLLWRASQSAVDWGGANASGTSAATSRGAFSAGIRHGALASGFAEYWDPDDGFGMGAVPQSWTGLVLLMNDSG